MICQLSAKHPDKLSLTSGLILARARLTLFLFTWRRKIFHTPFPGSRVILLAGVPGSGKSTMARRRYDLSQFDIHSTDAIRAKLYGAEASQGVWGDIETVLRSRILKTIRSHRVAIVDATHAQRAHRQKAIAWLRNIGVERIEALYVSVPLELCQQRNRSRERVVPEPVLNAMHRSLVETPPSVDDGFDGIETIENL